VKKGEISTCLLFFHMGFTRCYLLRLCDNATMARLKTIVCRGGQRARLYRGGGLITRPLRGARGVPSLGSERQNVRLILGD